MELCSDGVHLFVICCEHLNLGCQTFGMRITNPKIRDSAVILLRTLVGYSCRVKISSCFGLRGIRPSPPFDCDWKGGIGLDYNAYKQFCKDDHFISFRYDHDTESIQCSYL